MMIESLGKIYNWKCQEFRVRYNTCVLPKMR